MARIPFTTWGAQSSYKIMKTFDGKITATEKFEILDKGKWTEVTAGQYTQHLMAEREKELNKQADEPVAPPVEETPCTT